MRSRSAAPSRSSYWPLFKDHRSSSKAPSPIASARYDQKAGAGNPANPPSAEPDRSMLWLEHRRLCQNIARIPLDITQRPSMHVLATRHVDWALTMPLLQLSITDSGPLRGRSQTMPRQTKAERSTATRQPISTDLTIDFSSLRNMNVNDLRSMWKERVDIEPPNNRSAHLLRRLLAWQLQVGINGGLNRLTARRLSEIAVALERDGRYELKTQRHLSPGVVLTREWKGVIHSVTVSAGGFQYLGKRYGSLSDVARTITGTRWSGPRFFHLEQKKTIRQSEVTR